MNGEIPSVPITTLAGVASLTDLLPELPLPTPLPNTVSNKSLLYHQSLNEEGKKLLNSKDENIVSQLVNALKKTTTDNIELKDTLTGDSIESESPPLLRSLLKKDENVFKGSPRQKGSQNSGGIPGSNQQHPSPYQAGPSPCTPDSPARIPHGNTFQQASSSNPYQAAFMNFASQNAVASPARAAAAPGDQVSGSSERQPVVVLEPIQVNAILQPQPSSDGSVKKKKHKKSEDDSYNVIANQDVSTKLTLKISKTPSQDTKKVSGSKRRRSVDEEHQSNHVSDTPDISAIDMKNFQPSLSERVKRRRRQINYRDNEASDDEGSENSRSHKDKSKKKRRLMDDSDEEFMPQKDDDVIVLMPDKSVKPSHSVEGPPPRKVRGPVVVLQDCMEYSSSQKKFFQLIDECLEASEEADMGDPDGDDEDEDVSRAVIGKHALVNMCSEAAKLKTMGIMNTVPVEKLVKILTLLQYNIRDGCKSMPVMKDDDDDDGYIREITMEKMSTALDAGLVALYVMTSNEMPKEVFIEDVIESLVSMTKTQLQSVVFPEFDPVYRIDPKNKTGYVANLKAKRAKAGVSKNRVVLNIYNKLTELIAYLSELIEIQELTDTIILKTSTLAVSPFFVENISELQLNSLRLVTSVFSRYEKHRQLILEDILASLARLPSSKKNLRSYRLNSEEHIQMVTALALLLIQCVVKLPSPESPDEQPVDEELLIMTSFENAMRTAHNFLSVFLKKCTTKGEEDYRPLFENFVYDLLATVNKPEWPGAELLLSLLGRLLVQHFSNKSVDMSMRVASLDYLGIVASRLRKDAVTSRLNEKTIDEIIKHIQGKYEPQEEDKPSEEKEEESDKEDKATSENGEQTKEGMDENQKKESDNDEESKKSRKKKRKSKRRRRHHSSSSDDSDHEDDASSGKDKSHVSDSDSNTECLQQSLLEYLGHTAQNDPAFIFARDFYNAQWYRDCSLEVERASKKLDKLKTNNHDMTDELENLKLLQSEAENRKKKLLLHMNVKVGAFASFKPSPSRLSYSNACLVTRYLASSRPFSQSFEVYLTQILKVLCETAVAVRTRAMKCLTLVVEADPSILARVDMQRGVHGRLLDNSTSVREAAVELVGKFILSRPELTAQYYDMLSERILDTGISVRKRVIKIFRDICVEQPEFEKIPEMCVKMIRRVNDEEGIKKLVNETFQNMWFTPVNEREENITSIFRTKVMNITDVVNACKDTGYEWFEHLLENLLKKEEDAKEKPVETACTQLIECLVENVLKLESVVDSDDERGTCSPRLVACISTLHLFCKVKPKLLVRHAATLQPYLDIRCIAPGDFLVLHNIARMLELAVPLMVHPNENFLAQLEEDMMKLILKHGMMVLQSCVSCLGAIVNCVTHNYKLVRDCFQKFFGVLSRLMQEHVSNPNSPQLRASMPTLLRSLYTVGLLCRHFDFDSEQFGEKRVSIKDRVFDVLMYFVGNHEEEDVRYKALSGIGFFATRHYEFMMGQDLRDLYQYNLVDANAMVKMKCQVLRNLHHYLIEEESRMMRAEDEWKKLNNKEDLKEMGDIQSGMASTIIQVYLKQLLESFFHCQSQVRLAALNVIELVLRQGLVHPVQIVPYLISMGSDCDNAIRIKADQQLAEIDKKYPGFIQMKAMQGVKYSFRLQEILQGDPSEPIRGIRVEDNPIALSNFIYSLIRSNRGQRRAMLTSMLNLFDDSSRTPLNELIYMADNMAALPYQCQDEPLFVIHQIDILVSVSGSNVLQSYKEVFYPGSVDEEGKDKIDDDEDEDLDQLMEKAPEDLTQLNDLHLVTQGCLLLLMLKQHLKDLYGFTEAKLQRYSPTDNAKVWDRPLNRKHGFEFSPKAVLDLVKRLPLPSELDNEGKRQLLQDYIDFKGLMMSIDPNEEDEEDDIPKPQEKQSAAGTADSSKEKGDSKEDGGQGKGEAVPQPDGVEVIDLDDSGDKEELQAKNMSTTLTSSKSSYNRLLSMVTSSSSKRDTSSRDKGRDRDRHHKSQKSSRHRDHHREHHRDHHSHSSKPHKHKKKKKRKRILSESESEDDNSSDPDFTC